MNCDCIYLMVVLCVKYLMVDLPVTSPTLCMRISIRRGKEAIDDKRTFLHAIDPRAVLCMTPDFFLFGA